MTKSALWGAGLAMTLAVCGAGEPDAKEIAARVAAAERRLPWFWSPATEGLADIPYTYEALLTRRVTNRGGKELPGVNGTLGGWRSVRLERVPLDFGSFMRCLAADGKSPCSDEWNQEIERQAKRRESLTAEDRAQIEASREERRERRRSFWDAFPSTMRFANAGQNQVRFSPMRSAPAGILAAIDGAFWFDPATGEITRMEYDLMRDLDEPFLRFPKGTRFEITLTQAADQHYLPQRVFDRRRVVKTGNVEERTTEMSKFHRFEAESRIEFGDPKEVKK